MPRGKRQASRRARTQSSDSPVMLQAVAPLGVNAGSNAAVAAQGLAAALGLAGEVYADRRVRQIEDDQRKADTDFATGSVEEDGSKAYTARIEKLRLNRQVQQDAIEWEKAKSQVDLDVEDPTAAMDQAFSEFWGSRYNGYDGPGAEDLASVLDKLYTSEMQGVLEHTRESIVLQVMEDLPAAMDEFATESGYDHDGFLGFIESLPFIDGARIWEAYTGALIARAEETLDPTLLDVPAKVGKRGLPPSYKKALLAARDRVENAAQLEFNKDNAVRRANAYSALYVAANRMQLTDEMLQEGLDSGMIGPGDVRGLVLAQLQAKLSGATSNNAIAYIMQGKGELLSKKDREEGMDQLLTQMGREEGMSVEDTMVAIAQAAQANSSLPGTHKNFLSTVQPESGDDYLTAYEMYKTYREHALGALRAALPERAQQQFEAFNMLAEMTGAQEALNLIRNHDPVLAEKRLARINVPTTIREALNAAVKDSKDRGFLFWKQSVEENPQNIGEIRDVFDHFMGYGFLTPEQAAQRAVEYVKSSKQIVDNAFYDAGTWPVSNAQDLADWWKKSNFPREHKDMRFAPADSRFPGEVWLIRDNMPFVRVSLEELGKEWRLAKDAAARRANEETYKKNLDKVKDRLFPISRADTIRAGGMKHALEAREEWWNSISEEQQLVLFNQEMRKIGAEKARRNDHTTAPPLTFNYQN